MRSARGGRRGRADGRHVLVVRRRGVGSGDVVSLASQIGGVVMAWVPYSNETSYAYAFCITGGAFTPAINTYDCYIDSKANLDIFWTGPGPAYRYYVGDQGRVAYQSSATSDLPGPNPSGFVGGSGGSSSSVVTFGEPFNLSPSDGLLVGAAICAVWGAAFAWRSLRRVLSADETGGDH